VLVFGAGAMLVALTGGTRASSAALDMRHDTTTTTTDGHHVQAGPSHAADKRLPANVAVGVRIVTFVDRSRTVHFLNGSVEPRTLVTEIRYPAFGRAGANDLQNATPVRGPGPYPLVIFGHGFGETPAAYALLQDAWARAGYIVAAPVFPLTGASAPGGLNEPDLVNQPADVSFVISRLLAESARATGSLHGLIAPNLIAVSGQSDGGDTALADAYNPAVRDRRVRAAVILSGAEIPYPPGAFSFPRHGPPLLATQGTADTINLPSATSMFFALAPHPKFQLDLLGATHLPPYQNPGAYLTIVERVSIAFLDHYLKGQPSALHTMLAAGNVAGLATLHVDL
jgi:pimeloyl-ACP methyl ester carboxylesterase